MAIFFLKMHGLVMWNRETKKHTQLITWQGKITCNKPMSISMLIPNGFQKI